MKFYDNDQYTFIKLITVCALLGLIVPVSLSSQSKSCYRRFLDQGMAFYNQQRFEDAINNLEAAKVCPDRPKQNQLEELIAKVNDGYRDFLQIERDKALAAQKLAEDLRAVAENANEALSEQLIISKANSLAYLASLESEKGNHEDALKLAYTAYQQSDSLPVVLRVFGDVLFKAKSVPLTGSKQNIHQAIFHPIKQQLITSSDDHLIKIWDFEGNLLHQLKGHKGYINQLAINKQGTRIISGSHDQQVILWTADGKVQKKIAAHQLVITQLKFAPGGSYFVSADLNGKIMVWNLDGEQIAELAGHTAKITSLDFSADSEFILSTSADGSSKLWNKSGKQVTSLNGHTASVWSAKFLPDQEHILTYAADQTARLWTVAGVQTAMVRLDGLIKDAAIMAEGKQILLAQAQGTLSMWDGSPSVRAIPVSNGPINSTAINPNGAYFLTCSQDQVLRIWDANGSLVNTLVHPAAVIQAKFAIHSASVVSFAADGAAKFWNQKGNILLNWTPRQGNVETLVFSPDGASLFLASDAGEALLTPNPLQFLEQLKQNPLAPLSEEKKILYGLN